MNGKEQNRPEGMDVIPALVDLGAEGWVETGNFEFPREGFDDEGEDQPFG